MPLSYFVAMSKLEGRALELCQSINGIEYQKFTEMVQKTELPDQRPTIVHTHRLFHDAESTFWVMAWTLARSVPQNYLVEKEWPVAFADFVYAMEKHRPGSAKYETRLNTPRELEEWRNILHPSLSSMAPMLHQMYLYVSPEWGYRCELDPEHVHEVIMRLLLVEIVRIQDTNSDINITIGLRSMPRETASRRSGGKSQNSNQYQSSTPRSTSKSALLETPIGDSPRSTSQTAIHSSINSKKRRSSQLEGVSDPVPRRSPLLPSLNMPMADDCRFSRVINKAKGYIWTANEFNLERPQ